MGIPSRNVSTALTHYHRGVVSASIAREVYLGDLMNKWFTKSGIMVHEHQATAVAHTHRLSPKIRDGNYVCAVSKEAAVSKASALLPSTPDPRRPPPPH